LPEAWVEPPAATEATEAQAKASGPEAAAAHQSALAAALLEPEATAAGSVRAEAEAEPEKTTRPIPAKAETALLVTFWSLHIYEKNCSHF